MVMVPAMLDLKEDMFELDSEEIVAVYCQFVLRSMVLQPDRLESVMREIKNIHPCVTVVTEVEANHNSPVFVTRFIEALFCLVHTLTVWKLVLNKMVQSERVWSHST